MGNYHGNHVLPISGDSNRPACSGIGPLTRVALSPSPRQTEAIVTCRHCSPLTASPHLLRLPAGPDPTQGQRHVVSHAVARCRERSATRCKRMPTTNACQGMLALHRFQCPSTMGLQQDSPATLKTLLLTQPISIIFSTQDANCHTVHPPQQHRLLGRRHRRG